MMCMGSVSLVYREVVELMRYMENLILVCREIYGSCNGLVRKMMSTWKDSEDNDVATRKDRKVVGWREVVCVCV